MSLIGVHMNNKIFYKRSDIDSVNEMMKQIKSFRYHKMQPEYVLSPTEVATQDEFIHTLELGPNLRFIINPTNAIYAYIVGIDAYCVLRETLDPRWGAINPSAS